MPVEVRPTTRFERQLKTLDSVTRTRAAKSIKQFLLDPRHPSLHFEKLKGTDVRTIRVDMNFRIAMRAVGGSTYDLIDVGSHDDIYGRWG